ncbi:hypothetical protein AAFF_G00333860, partial [Aldrovandia affinis]
MQLFAGLVLIVSFCFSCGDEVKQEVPTISKQEEEQVSLECSYETSSTNVYLYWYRQYTGSAPQFILYNGNSKHNAEFAKTRFSSTVDKSNRKTVLKISGLIPEDTAMYYCALWTTVVHN